MTFQPGQSGNPSGTRKQRLFRDALMMELKAANEDRKELRKVARALITKAVKGDVNAVKEVADRVDGKVPQAHIGGDEDDPAIKQDVNMTLRIVDGTQHPEGV